MMATHSRFGTVVVVAVIIATLAGCSSDPTAGTACDHVRQDLRAAQSAVLDAEEQLAEVRAELEEARGPEEVSGALRELQESWTAAWSARDGEAVVRMMAPGARHSCPGTGPEGRSGAELARFVERGFELTDATIVSAVCTEVPGSPDVVERDCLVTTHGTLNGHAGYATVLHVRGTEGDLRVVDHHAYP